MPALCGAAALAGCHRPDAPLPQPSVRASSTPQAKGYWELGRLGPDYHDSPEWKAKWERREREKEFGQAARAINQLKVGLTLGAAVSGRV